MKSQLRWLFLALPFLGVGAGMRMLVPRWGDAIARAVSDVVGAPPAQASEAGPVVEAPPPEEVPDAAIAVADAGAVKHTVAGRAADSGADDGGPLSLYVKADAVDRALSQHGKHVRGRTAYVDGKPVGVRLTGISAVGVGLQDGDLIVAIDGQPTMDDDVATDVLLGAIAHGKTVIKVKLLRGERPIDLTVEVPLDAQTLEGDAGAKP